MATAVHRYFLLIVVCAFLVSPLPASAANSTKAKVLLLNSYHNGLSWTDKLTQAIQQKVNNATTELTVEYLDSKRHKLGEIWLPMLSYLAQKYSAQNLDAIIVSDNNALQFINSEHEQLFPGVPVIFCGINFFQPELIDALRPQVTGATEEIAPLATVKLMQKLQPDLQRLIVVSGTTETSRANRETCRQQFQNLPATLHMEWWSNLNTASLLEKLSTLDPRYDGVLLLSFGRDKDGAYLSFEEQGQRLSAAASAPIYGLWDFYLGTGVLGGKVISATEQGTLAADLCLQLLNGRSAAQIPIQRHLSGRLEVDARVLKRFHIPQHLLPAETNLLFQEHSFYTTHTRETWLAISLFLLLSILTLSLAISKKKQARATSELRSGEAHLRTVLNSITDAVLAVDKKGILLGLNPVAEKLLSCSPLEYVGQRLDSFFVVIDTITREPLPCVKKQSLLQTQLIQFPEHSTLVAQNKQEYQIAGSISALRENNGLAVGSVITFRDISKDYALHQQLSQEKKRFKVVTDSLNDALILLDTQLRNTTNERSRSTHLRGQPRQLHRASLPSVVLEFSDAMRKLYLFAGNGGWQKCQSLALRRKRPST